MRAKIATLILTLLLATALAETADAKNKKRAIPGYTLTKVESDILTILGVNNRGDVLIERQLERSVPGVPLVIRRNGKETATFECPSTSIYDTDAEGINNEGDIVGHCGHDRHAPGLFAFVHNPIKKTLTLLSVPGSTTTWGYGINDGGDVVGIYTDSQHAYHSFAWTKATGEYRIIYNPLATGDRVFTWLLGINTKGQMIGRYNTERNLPWEQYYFIYDNGTFLPIVYPGSSQTHAVAINNDSQVLGWRSGPGCSTNICLFLYDDNLFFDVELPLPPNEPRPDGLPAGNARLIDVAGLNDKGQFVGAYVRNLEYRINEFGDLSAFRIEVVHFVATPGR